MKALFDQIDEIQPKLPGWCKLDKAYTLASMVVAKRPMISVEIGVYGGSSLIPIALAHKHIDSGMAVGIDPWDRHAAVVGSIGIDHRVWWDQQDMEGLFNTVRGTIAAFGLHPYVNIIRRKSSEVPNIPVGIGLLHIDGAHDDQAVNDVARYAGHVEIGGFVVMDDLGWIGGGPGRAAQRLVQMGFKHLYKIQEGAAFQRIR